ncbi:MAG: hypothetical protein LBH71_04785 [Oscillospiraceae bacterium]|jgi:hypothetical protein|nr:hypothetical protein [Oscillospiraceae bacterium]
MGMDNDSDVKIYGQSGEDEDRDRDETIRLIEETHRQRKNGNSQKAKQLGKDLAAIAPGEKYFPENLEDEFMEASVLEQVCALLLFSSEAALQYYLPSPFLSTIAINTLQDRLSAQENPLYTAALDGSAFSLYYLDVRKEDEGRPNDVGAVFARLCAKQGYEKYELMGKDIYTNSLKNIRDRIKSFKFKK